MIVIEASESIQFRVLFISILNFQPMYWESFYNYFQRGERTTVHYQVLNLAIWKYTFLSILKLRRFFREIDVFVLSTSRERAKILTSLRSMQTLVDINILVERYWFFRSVVEKHNEDKELSLKGSTEVTIPSNKW